MRRVAILLIPVSLGLLATGAGAETRCGWYSNPTPANHWLQDADGEWTLSVQGMGDRDSGFFDAPWGPAPPNSWVETNGHYGYGCACFEGEVDPATGWATKVISVTPLPLSRCKDDPALPPR